MKPKGIFPAKANEFHIYVSSSYKYLLDSSKRLGINKDALGELGEKMDEWKELFPKSQDKNQRTATIVAEKDKLRLLLKEKFRGIYADIPQSFLTIEDRTALNLKARDTKPTPVPAADQPPGISIREIRHLMHVVYFTNRINPDTRQMPAGQKLILEICTGEAGLDEKELIFTKLLLVTTHIKRIEFTFADVGKTAYYRARYVNTRGETGPAAAIFKALVA